MQKIIIFIYLSFFISCTIFPESIGEKNEIIVITSPEDKDLVKVQIDRLFSHIIYTPQPENECSIKFKKPWDLDHIKEHGALIIASLDFPKDSTGDLLITRITAKNNQENSLFILKDLYARNQNVFVIHTTEIK